MKFLRKLQNLWNRPHPFIFNLGSLLVPALITFMVLFFFRPFAFANYTLGNALLWSILFSMVPPVCIFLVVKMLQKVVPGAIDEENWTLGKEVVLVLGVILLIAFMIYLLLVQVSDNNMDWRTLQEVLGKTGLISILPVLILVLFEQYNHQKKQHKETKQLNEELLQQQKSWQETSHLTQEKTVRLYGENAKLALQIDRENFIYAQSEGNYVDVFHKKNDKLTKTIVRNSLKSLEEQLDTPNFYRCHRRYLVSLAKIESISGNARNLELTMAGTEEKIPVARSKSKELTAKLENGIDTLSGTASKHP